MKSRQRKYQLKQQEDGKCTKCGDNAVNKYYCEKHLLAHRLYYRNLYRKKNGIAIDSPLKKSGRPRFNVLAAVTVGFKGINHGN